MSQPRDALTGLELSPTLVFEHPTPRAIATHLSARAGGADGDGGAAAAAADASDVTPMRAAAGGGAVAVGSAVGRWPGGAPTVGALWAALRAGGDLVTAVPAARWTADQAAAARPLSEREAACVRHGGFVAGAERFDGRFFGVSAAEAAAIDPQQRLLLEHGYEALHGAALTRASLLGSATAVFVGLEQRDWALLQASRAVGGAVRLRRDGGRGVDRIGAAVVRPRPPRAVRVDSTRRARRRWSRCTARRTRRAAASARARSSRRRASSCCRTRRLARRPRGALGRRAVRPRAPTYVRSEAVRALVVWAAEGGSGARASRASAMRRDGRSASLTAPNGLGARALLRAALALAACAAAAAAWAHGTAARGDPSDAAALRAAVGGGRRWAAGALTVGAAKASTGHSEAPSALLGVGEARAQASLAQPHVGAAVGVSAAARAPTQLSASPLRVGGVSSLGYSGAIAHAVVRAAPPAAAAPSRDAGRAPIRLRRRAYPWRAPDAPPHRSTRSSRSSRALRHTLAAARRNGAPPPRRRRRHVARARRRSWRHRRRRCARGGAAHRRRRAPAARRRCAAPRRARSRRWRGVALVLAGATSAEPAGVHGAVVAARSACAARRRPRCCCSPPARSGRWRWRRRRRCRRRRGGACGVARALARRAPLVDARRRRRCGRRRH